MKKITPKTQAIVATALTGVLAVGIGTVVTQQSTKAGHHDGQEGMEKCAGIVKAGMNDCGAYDHDCAGMSTGDATEAAHEDEWLYVTEGTCEKIVGGRLL